MSQSRIQTFRVLVGSTGAAVADRATEARSLPARLVGLIGRKELVEGEALWLRANGVHTFGMRFAIDVVILDSGGRVLRVAEKVSPNRIVWPTRGGRITLELPAGSAARANVVPGDRIIRNPPSRA